MEEYPRHPKGFTENQQAAVHAVVHLGATGSPDTASTGSASAAVHEVLRKLDGVLLNTPHKFVALTWAGEGAGRLVADAVRDWPASDGVEKGKALERGNGGESGIHVADHCDVMIVFGDRSRLKGPDPLANVIDYARRAGRPIFWISPGNSRMAEDDHQERLDEGLGYLDCYNSEQLGDLDERFKKESNRLRAHARQAQSANADSGPDFLTAVSDNLLRQFVRADALAVRYQSRHMWSGAAVYGLAAVAVAIAAIQPLVFPQFPQILWAEVASIISVICILVASSRCGWHRKWIDYRFLAERLRAAIFLRVGSAHCHPLEPLAQPYLAHRPNGWMVVAFSWLWGSLGETGCNEAGEDLPAVVQAGLKEFILDEWIERQRIWFEDESTKQRRQHRRMEYLGLGLFGLTFVAAGFHATGILDVLLSNVIHLPSILALLAIVLPAIGAALAGFRIHKEYARNADRYAEMVRALTPIEEKVRNAPDPGTLAEALREANDIMLRENQNWRIDFRFQNLRIPWGPSGV